MIISKDCADIKIVVSENAAQTELFAASELVKYIKKMTGAELSVCKDVFCEGEKQIIIGGPHKNQAAARLLSPETFEKEVPGPEGMMIKSFGADCVFIAGSEDSNGRGTIYGVYEFLERFSGCSLAAFTHPGTDAGEYVPSVDQIEIGEISYLKRCASRPFRGACVQYGSWAGNCERGLNRAFFDWLAKNRYNYFYTWTSVYEKMKKLGLAAELIKRGIDFVVGHHDALDLFLPADGNEYFPERYEKTHPEFYRLQKDGTRFHPQDSGGQIIFCCRNEELVEEVSRNIITWLDKNPGVKLIQLAPHDGKAEQCVCEKCAPFSKTENYAEFLSKIAAKVNSAHPDVRIILLVYVDIWECPEKLQLAPSLIAMEATWAAGGHKGLRTAGKPDGSCLSGSPYEENLLRWKEAGADVMYYDYYMGVYVMRQRYFPIADEIQAIWKRFCEKGILGASTQIECFNLWNHIFNFYTFGRTGYDVSLSMEDNLEKFSKIFGSGAEWMKKAIRHAEDCLDGQLPMPFCPEYLFHNLDQKFMHDCFNRALKEAETASARNSIRLFRMVFRYTELEQLEENANSSEQPFVRNYPNINPELLYMTKFDSYWKNDPGYGITIALDKKEGDDIEPFTHDEWYSFE